MDLIYKHQMKTMNSSLLTYPFTNLHIILINTIDKYKYGCNGPLFFYCPSSRLVMRFYSIELILMTPQSAGIPGSKVRVPSYPHLYPLLGASTASRWFSGRRHRCHSTRHMVSQGQQCCASHFSSTTHLLHIGQL